MNTFAEAVLVAFYLFLSIRWNHVRRKWAYMAGVVGVATSLLSAALAGSPLGEGRAPLGALGMVVALLGAVAACCPEPLAFLDGGTPNSPAPPQPPAGTDRTGTEEQ